METFVERIENVERLAHNEKAWVLGKGAHVLKDSY